MNEQRLDGRLAGFIDWDMAGPVSPGWDLAYAAFSWVPLHARRVVAREGFTDFAARPEPLRLFLAAYGWAGPVAPFLDVVRDRIQAHVAGLRRLAAAGDPLFARIVSRGGADDWRPRWPNWARPGSRSEHRYFGQWQRVTWPRRR